MTPDKIASQYETAINRFLEIATLLPAHLRTAKGAAGEWTVQQVLAHMTYWDQNNIANLEAAAAGRPFDLDEGDVDARNLEAVASRAGLTWDQQIQEVESTRDRRILLHHQPTEIDFSGSGDHWNEHRELLEAWLRSINETFGPNSLTPDQISDQYAERSGFVIDIATAIPEDRRFDPGVAGGWSLKDLMGHLAYWDSVTLAMIRRKSDLDSGDDDSVNAEEAARRADWTWEQVMTEVATNRARRISLHLIPLEMDLTDVGSHWAEHGAQIEAWVAQHIGGE